MKLKPLIATLALFVTMTTGGCVVHFPLAENGPSLQGSNEPPSTADTSQVPAEPNTNNPIKGNTADAPE